MIKSEYNLLFKQNNKSDRNISHVYKTSQGVGGFTIVELIIVMVIIGILSAITIVSYTGITQRAVVTSLKSDLSNASDMMKIYQTHYGSYPTAMTGNCPTAPTADNTYCIKASTGNTLTYTSITPSTFYITGTNASSSYTINDTTGPAIATTTAGSSVGSACPTGFIPVPGSGTYSTDDFCVMKYAASQVGATNVPVSVPSVQPWVNISQTTAIANARNVAGCTGCHLITEAEYMTIAQNVLSVPSNWSSGIVGTGYIYSGHNDNAPANAIVPNSSDTLGYAGETNTGGTQKRTLTLTNGQVIWDFAGNVYEWTNGATDGTTAQQPGVAGNAYASWVEWPAVTTPGSLPINPSPSGIGISGSGNWNSSKGIGELISNAADTNLRGFIRGGSWDSGGGIGGVLALNLNAIPNNTNPDIGFRVSR